jgi:hypothetical protein
MVGVATMLGFITDTQHKNHFSGKVLNRLIYQINKKSIIFGLEFSPVEKVDFRGGKYDLGEVRNLTPMGSGSGIMIFPVHQALSIIEQSSYFILSILSIRLSIT